MSKIELKSVFSVPIIKFKFTKHNNYQFPDIERSERIPEGWTISLNSSYPGISDDQYISDKEIESLKDDIMDDIEKVLNKLGISNNIKFDNFWYNVYHEDQGQEMHDHLSACAPTYWSGIYYNKRASPTLFHAPTRYMKLHEPLDYTNDVMYNFFSDNIQPEVEDGDIILFPPYLLHEVIPDKTRKDMRLTFAFNIILKER